MNFFKRLFNIGKAEANSAIDKLEDPIKMTEQGIRDLKSDLDDSLKALAEIKALAIRSRNDLETYIEKSKDYEQKAMLVLKSAQAGKVTAEEADRLASEALLKKNENLQHVERTKKESNKYENSLEQLNGNIQRLKQEISKYENELKTLKARVKVSSATKKINQQMAQIDSSSTIATIERMKEKVAQEEALAEAYGEIANESKSIDEEIDKVIGDNKQLEIQDQLAELKKSLNTEEEK